MIGLYPIQNQFYYLARFSTVQFSKIKSLKHLLADARRRGKN